MNPWQAAAEAENRARSARARRLPIKRRAHSRHTVHAHASCVPRYSRYICRCRASFSATSSAARVRARRACACRQGFGGAGRGRGRGRLLALPCPSPVSATAHLIRYIAGLRQHQHLQQRVRPVPPSRRALSLAASLFCTAARPAFASAFALSYLATDSLRVSCITNEPLLASAQGSAPAGVSSACTSRSQWRRQELDR